MQYNEKYCANSDGSAPEISGKNKQIQIKEEMKNRTCDFIFIGLFYYFKYALVKMWRTSCY